MSKVANENLQNQENETSTLNVELNDALFKFIDLEEHSRSNVSITGKPKLLIIDIISRFVKNYVALFSLIFIVILCICCLIFPAISPYSPDTKITLSAEAQWIIELPSSYSPYVTKVLSENDFANLKNEIEQAKLDFSTIVIKDFIFEESQSHFITYDAYKLIELKTGQSNFLSIIGTNSQGFDIWTRTWTAARDSFTLAFLVATTDAVIGITIGCVLGFHAGKWIDTVLSRVVDVINNIPTIIWFLVLMTLIGKNNINYVKIYLVLISLGWTYMVNSSRLWVITVKDQEFILASKAIGCTTSRQIFVHALPMIIGKLATNYVRRIVAVIMSISSLVFLGFLDSSSAPNLGTVLKEAIPLMKINYWSLLLPALILLFFSLTMQFVANGLHDALDPRVGRGK